MDYKYVAKIIKSLPAHNHDLYSKVKDVSLTKKDQEFYYKKTASVIERLNKLGLIKKRYKKNLCFLIYKGILLNRIEVISMNSHALSKRTNTLRDKPQYKKNYELNIFLKMIENDLDVRISYIPVLCDLDKDFPLLGYSEYWDLNRAYLEREARTKVVRLSEIMKKEDFFLYNNPGKIKKINGLIDLIEKYKNSKDIMIDFNTDGDFIEKQIISYVTVGIILERRLPDIFVLDIQRKHYPFEQPFYNYYRRVAMPIIYCGY